MNNGKFLRLFTRLETPERTAFRKYLRGRYANEKILLHVYEYIHKHVRDAASVEKFEVDYANRKIFGRWPDFDPDHRLRLLNALSDLFLRLREFLLLGMLRHDSTEMQYMWLAILNVRRLDAEYEREALRMLEQQQKAPKTGVRAYLGEVAIGYYYNFYSKRSKAAPDLELLGSSIAALDVYYAVTRLKMMCEIATSRTVFQLDNDVPETVSAALDIARRAADAHPLLALYYELYLLLTRNADADLARAETLLFAQQHTLQPDELKFIVPLFRNVLTARISKGEAVKSNMHAINQLGLAVGAFDSPANMPVANFNAIVNAACSVRDFAWAEKFIAVQKHLLPENSREAIEQLARATIAFEKKQFEEVRRILGKIQLRDLSSRLRIRTLSLCCQYELDDTDNLLDRCDNFLASVRRLKSSRKMLLARAHGFALILRLLAEKKVSQQHILHQIQETQQLNMRSWLIEKAKTYKQFVH